MLATLPPSPVPSISIHFAAEELPVPEPASPFNRTAFNASSPKLPSPLSPSYNRDDLLRSPHLLPPPVLSPKQAEHQQHLKAAKASGGAGLDQARFQALLQASRSSTGTSRALDLRKEVAWKAHKTKQRQSYFSRASGTPPAGCCSALCACSTSNRHSGRSRRVCHCKVPIHLPLPPIPPGVPVNLPFSAARGTPTSTP